MKKVRVTIRLYRMHDLDLITFVELHELNLQKAVYCALTSFTKGELFLIKIPPRRESGKELKLNRVYAFTMLLDTEKDKDAILLLSKITDGKRNNFLKNLLRLYLCNPMSEMFLESETDVEYFYDKFAIFRTGRRVADLSEDKKRNSVPGKKMSDTEVSGKDHEVTIEHPEAINETRKEMDVDKDSAQQEEIEDNKTESQIAEDDADIMGMFSALL